ncbi:CRP/FNR family transcriptional regulator, anaerobic regulatory protein [Lutibacter oricola]|uniref:CRP/FNR family transcriptional regulator, anaerobic regulatory protein n=1 Tax=Lutibacter oricola TaxID=762486 RepID=A0A1H2S278_9FLAO|nr:Crp/Fnr family transcriptional regulator [Lutibacter oricola]SDW25747.1 CRP/FNR family transcriptional regulator, anaerobic regulatory protein [Lutibacter oricola]
MKIDEIVKSSFSEIFESELLQEIIKYGVLKKVDPKTIIVEVRRDVQFIPLIVSGIAKVKRRDGKGNGIFLHYLSAKETSAIAISSAIQHKKSEIRIKAENIVTYIALPIKVVSLWFSKYNNWRAYFFNLNEKQTSLLIEKINDIAFNDLEFRLVKYLEETSFVKNDHIIYRKHFDIARDLKVSRESISRVLKKLEKEEILTLGRNKIILN